MLIRAFRCTSAHQFKQQLNLPPDTYTLSLWWYRYASAFFKVVITYNDNSNSAFSVLGEQERYNYYEVTFTALKNIKEISLSDRGTAANPVFIVEPMLEYGNNPSTASPNPDDVAEEIQIVDGKYGEQIIELGNRITTTKEEFETEYWKKTVGQQYVDGVKTTVQNDYNTKFTQTANQISSKAEKTVTDSLGNRLSQAESNITQTATEIASKVSQTTFDALGNRVTQAESDISQQATEIASKVSQTTFNQFSDRVSTAESNITQNANNISQKVSQTTFDALGNRVTAAESSITQTATEIASKVSNSEMQSAINQKADEINLSVTNLKGDLAATGINIQQKEIVVTAPKFKVQKPDGTSLAIFDDNINIDNDGNMTLKSLRTPYQFITPTKTRSVFNINFDETPHVIIQGAAGGGGYVDLPNAQKYNGALISVAQDSYAIGGYDGVYMNIIRANTNRIYKQDGTKVSQLWLPNFRRIYYTFRGVWAGTQLLWFMEDTKSMYGKVNIKAGEIIGGGRLHSSTIDEKWSVFGDAAIGHHSVSGSEANIGLQGLMNYTGLTTLSAISDDNLKYMCYPFFPYHGYNYFEVSTYSNYSNNLYSVKKRRLDTNVFANFSYDTFFLIASKDIDLSNIV